MSDLDFSCCGLVNGACSRQIPYDIEKHDKMIYQQGRADAIDECIKIVDKYDSVIANYLREELKEQKRR